MAEVRSIIELVSRFFRAEVRQEVDEMSPGFKGNLVVILALGLHTSNLTNGTSV